ncbi:glycoside hydrolase family 38 N-terminal domain-containing protein [Paenibacillus roseipurpureus]|uniref:Glycoside hydrolase family 38 C-terminal domain-containing protein n=1 Tax=Paenibacillus roseopurpureus TaxID=2918901 RepID=A0AA96LPS5_9BACL|nr:glycoside hydrolase family 38 C-terminal domain-containing protein [Paenibacillus sp. MBLB1832]WNR46007.1 glycoside hydrolase family 38 C-terminal domain-containing protein [Paenibacillus sp. MBLB1832]
MKPMKKTYMVVAITHIDLSWKKNECEMAELFDIFIIRLLDSLEQYPAFTYVLEQAYHYRSLQQRRPDLLERLKRFVQEGRLEVVGGMASTLETNVPNGECYVRNQSIGTQWMRETFGVTPTTGWLVDTFGIHAQVPQILKQFGQTHLLANRFGGTSHHDVFRARGLDGTETIVVGWHSYSSYVAPLHVAKADCSDWQAVDTLFARAEQLQGEGPFIVIPFVENEMMLGLHHMEQVRHRQEENGNEEWKLALPRDYFQALEVKRHSLPVVHSDLNPEFTGTFALRTEIRTTNRRVETLLLEAEKWNALAGGLPSNLLEEAWWGMAYAQFHDVFTGSHPTPIFRDLMVRYGQMESSAQTVLSQSERRLNSTHTIPTIGANHSHYTIMNGLPWDRVDLITLPLRETESNVTNVNLGDGQAPFEIRDGQLHVRASVPAAGAIGCVVEYESGVRLDEVKAEEVTSGIIENEHLLLECDTLGIKRFVLKHSGVTLIENAANFLVIQPDTGSFQIEHPNGGEVSSTVCRLHIRQFEATPICQRLLLSGEFPKLPWAGNGNKLHFELEFMLLAGKPRLDIGVKLKWQGEQSRIRFKLATALSTSEAIYEIPFGTVRRKPYIETKTAKGEWPAHRFVAIEDGEKGIALINTGVVGAEIVAPGTLAATLLRAPQSIWANVPIDAQSSQHGEHTFTFALVPYNGSWHESHVLEMAQEVNNPLQAIASQSILPAVSHVRLEPSHVVLSAIQAAADHSGELIVRVYETAGLEGNLKLFVLGAEAAWASDLQETKHEQISCMDDHVTAPIRPFEIKTIRIARRVTV